MDPIQPGPGPQLPPQLPAKLGNYRIEERLGSGGMGVVYRAFDEVLERPLAIKHLIAQKAGPTASLRFRREARAAARLNHPAIVHIYDVVETEQGDWIVMELVQGRTLDRLIHEGTLGLGSAVRLGKEIAEGLAEAHAHGIIHRDLKAPNVMVTPAGRAKILDFGLAKFLLQEDEAELSQAGIVLGTYHAMSPEQIQGRALDHRTDLFSFGSLLYEMLTGISPFRAATVPDTLARICRHPHEPVWRVRPEVPRELSALVDRLLRKGPRQRPERTEEVARLLESFERAGLSSWGMVGGTGRPGAVPGGAGGMGTEPDLGWSLELSGGATLVQVPAAQLPPAAPPSLPDLSALLPAATAPAGSTVRPMPPSPPSLPSGLSSSRTLTQSSRPTSERRQVTVACCELTGTAGSPRQAFDPETLQELMLRLRNVAAAVAGRHAGSLGSVLGHRMLLYFGYPQAHEDSAARAVRAALDLVEEAAQMDSGLGPGHKPGVALRIGVHTGPAVVALDSSSPEPVTLGATLDLAMELPASAEPGEVVVSPATSALVRRGFALEALAPGSAFRVLGPLGQAEDHSQAGLMPMVGRAPEMDLLLSRWHLAREGSGQVVLIGGDPGIGKSRLVQALRERIGEGAARWLSCYGSPYTQNSPLQTAVSLLRRALALPEGAVSAEQLASALRDLGSGDAAPVFAPLLDVPDGAPPALPPDRLRERTLEALVALVLGIAERQPLVLVVEDVHWLDPTTLEWLDRLIEQAPAAPLFLLLTRRLHPPEAAWAPRSAVTQIGLSPLPEMEAERLIGQVLREHDLPESVRQQIVARTDGVPLFLEELTKAVLESQGSDKGRELPSTLSDSLTARLDNLGPAKELAQLAAVIGRVFSLDLLAAVSECGEAELQPDLRRLIQAEMIYRRGTGKQTKYLFKHALVQDAAYGSLLKRARQQLHLRIAETLEAQFPQTVEAQPELLAYHYQEADQAGPAVRYWFRAGGQAASRSASQEALHHLGAALRLLDGMPEAPERDRRELEVQNALAAATITGRGYLDPGVEGAYARAAVLAERLEEVEEGFWAVLGLHTYHLLSGNHGQARPLVERLLSLAEAAGSPSLLAIAWFSRGGFHYWECEYAVALAELERAYELAPPDDVSYLQRTGTDLRVMALSFGAVTLWNLGFADQARRRGAQAVALARELGHPFTLAFARLFCGAGLPLCLREPETVRKEAKEIYDLAVELGFPLFIWQNNFLLVWAESQLPGAVSVDPAAAGSGLGDFASVQAMIEQDTGTSTAFYTCLHAEILAAQGRFGEALQALERGMALARTRGATPWSEELPRLRGEMLLATGSPGATAGPAGPAEAFFREALEQARRKGTRIFELRAALSLGRLWRSQGRRAEAAELVQGVYGGFTEGFEARDLKEARAFLGSLQD